MDQLSRPDANRTAKSRHDQPGSSSRSEHRDKSTGGGNKAWASVTDAARQHGLVHGASRTGTYAFAEAAKLNANVYMNRMALLTELGAVRK